MFQIHSFRPVVNCTIRYDVAAYSVNALWFPPPKASEAGHTECGRYFWSMRCVNQFRLQPKLTLYITLLRQAKQNSGSGVHRFFGPQEFPPALR
jgi:hypothetical protein